MTKKMKISISKSEFRGRPRMARSRLQGRPEGGHNKVMNLIFLITYHMVLKENNKKNICFMFFVFI